MSTAKLLNAEELYLPGSDWCECFPFPKRSVREDLRVGDRVKIPVQKEPGDTPRRPKRKWCEVTAIHDGQFSGRWMQTSEEFEFGPENVGRIACHADDPRRPFCSHDLMVTTSVDSLTDARDKFIQLAAIHRSEKDLAENPPSDPIKTFLDQLGSKYSFEVAKDDCVWAFEPDAFGEVVLFSLRDRFVTDVLEYCRQLAASHGLIAYYHSTGKLLTGHSL